MDKLWEKKAIRTKIRQSIAVLSYEEMERQSAAACEKLIGNKSFAEAKTVLVYSAVRGECDPARIADAAAKMGKRVAYPKCCGDDLALYIANQSQLSIGAYGILEPIQGCQRIDISEVDFAVIPGVAFDRHGGRLGRGKGYYDRLLKDANAVKAGLCFNEQLLKNVPMEPHDGRMDMIAAEKWDILLIK